jgi:hypothetical protein
VEVKGWGNAFFLVVTACDIFWGVVGIYLQSSNSSMRNGRGLLCVCFQRGGGQSQVRNCRGTAFLVFLFFVEVLEMVDSPALGEVA